MKWSKYFEKCNYISLICGDESSVKEKGINLAFFEEDGKMPDELKQIYLSAQELPVYFKE